MHGTSKTPDVRLPPVTKAANYLRGHPVRGSPYRMHATSTILIVCTCMYVYTRKFYFRLLFGMFNSHLAVFLGATKVNKFDHSPRSDHDVSSFDISVDDSIGVKIVQGPCDLTSVVGYRTAVQWTESVCVCV